MQNIFRHRIPANLVRRTICCVAAVFLAAVFLTPRPAHAVPSFARQTGVACEACHTVFPELTPFGRDFKMNGYILQNANEVSAISEKNKKILTLADLPPISFMFDASMTSTNRSVPDTVVGGREQNAQVEFPQQASFFYAGKIAPHLGAFVQLTYSGPNDAFSADNTDIRAVDTGAIGSADIVYGLSFNNNMTVEDVFNSVPAWGFPFWASATAPTPTARTVIDGTLAQDVAGLTAYFQINRSFYGEAGVYRTARLGQPAPLSSIDSNVVEGVAPYWRFAYEHRWGHNSWEAGTFGTHVVLAPGSADATGTSCTTASGTPGFCNSITSGPYNYFTDAALDTQYEFIGDRDIFTVTGVWIHENAERDADVAFGSASRLNSVLQTARLSAEYFYERTYGASIQYFTTWGDADPVLYAPASVTGSNNGKPNSNGEVFELNYVPWLNTKLSLQYVAYNEFNGASSNYDGFNRNASDNNTLLLNFWFAF
ncbi:MAG: hypothetical protein WAN51_02270 [Alphaproteobacteria bacterium]